MFGLKLTTSLKHQARAKGAVVAPGWFHPIDLHLAEGTVPVAMEQRAEWLHSPLRSGVSERDGAGGHSLDVFLYFRWNPEASQVPRSQR